MIRAVIVEWWPYAQPVLVIGCILAILWTHRRSVNMALERMEWEIQERLTFIDRRLRKIERDSNG